MHEWDSHEDFVLSEMPWPDADSSKIRLLPPDQPALKNRLLKVTYASNISHNMSYIVLLQVQSMEGRSDAPLRPCVAKSYSFGGYGGSVSVLSRGDSVTSTHSAGPRLLTKQDSSTSTMSWRLSPSSSGYKSQSQRSDSVTPSPTATPHPDLSSGKSSLEEQSSQDRSSEPADKQLVWAVTDMGSVPKGSVLIDPHTGQPLTNQDGSIYHFDPSNPPPGFSPPSAAKPPPSPVKSVATSPRKSPLKEHSSPARSKPRGRASPAKTNKINSATSPSLPAQVTSPPVQPYLQPSLEPCQGGMQPVQPYPASAMYTGQPEPFPPVMYPPAYQQYDSRPDSAVSDMGGYFVNMAISEPAVAQPMTFAQPQYWTGQPQPPVSFYQAAQPTGKWQQTTYVPTSYMTGYPPPPPAQVEPVPLYGSPVYSSSGQQTPGPYMQSPAQVLYAPQGTMYQQGYAYPSPATPTPTPSYSGGYAQYGQGYECVAGGRTSRGGGKNKPSYSRSMSISGQSQQSHSSGGSSSPANTIISGYYQHPPPVGPMSGPTATYRQCTPPETPPTQTMPPFAYPPPAPYPAQTQHPALMFRQVSITAFTSHLDTVFNTAVYPVQMGSIRASPPVQMRGSRSPTPAPEFPPGADRAAAQRFPPAAALYGMGLPCILPGDLSLYLSRLESRTVVDNLFWS